MCFSRFIRSIENKLLKSVLPLPINIRIIMLMYSTSTMYIVNVFGKIENCDACMEIHEIYACINSSCLTKSFCFTYIFWLCSRIKITGVSEF